MSDSDERLDGSNPLDKSTWDSLPGDSEAYAEGGRVVPLMRTVATTMLEASGPAPEVSIDLSIYLPDGRRFQISEAVPVEDEDGEVGPDDMEGILYTLRQIGELMARRIEQHQQFLDV